MSLPYWRLSSFYFFYFALLGAFIPYWGLFLQAEGFSAREIGYLSGAVMATKIFAPSIWGYLADRTGHPLSVIRLGSLLALIVFCGVFLSREFAWMLAVVSGYSFFWNAVLAQFEVVTLRYLGSAYADYSRIRLWGSVGFISTAALLGLLFEFISISRLPIVMALTLMGIWLCSLSIGNPSNPASSSGARSLRHVLLKPSVLGFLLVCLLMQVGHGPYYTFYSIYMESLGHGRGFIGAMWALGVLAEVVLFLMMQWLLPRFGVRRLLLFSLWLAVVRWLIIGFLAENLLLLVVAQLLHAATFGLFHAAGIEFIRRSFPHGLAGQGQALYSGISFGAGGAVGAILSGVLWDSGAAATFLMASVATGLALLIAWRFVDGEIA